MSWEAEKDTTAQTAGYHWGGRGVEVTWSRMSGSAVWGDSIRGGIVIAVTHEESWSVRPQQLDHGDGVVGDQGQIKGCGQEHVFRTVTLDQGEARNGNKWAVKGWGDI